MESEGTSQRMSLREVRRLDQNLEGKAPRFGQNPKGRGINFWQKQKGNQCVV